MKSPYEELEYIADHLPDEGEAVVVSRQRGEIVCEAYREPTPTSQPQVAQKVAAVVPPFPTAPIVENNLPGLTDPALYGRLLQANERLKGCVWSYIWPWVLSIYWLCVGCHWLTTSGWSTWYLDIGIALIVSIGAIVWIQHQQWKLFHNEICPVLERQMAERETNKYKLLSEMRQHPELKLLVTVLSRWTT